MQFETVSEEWPELAHGYLCESGVLGCPHRRGASTPASGLAESLALILLWADYGSLSYLAVSQP